MELVTPDIGLIFWMTVSFTIVLAILKKFAWKPILQGLKDREDSIKESLSSAEKAREEMAKLKSDNEQLLADARLERDKIIKEALATASNIKEDAKTEASKISGKMIEDARTAISSEKQEAVAEIKRQVASLSLEIAEKLLRKNLSDSKDQRALVDQFINEVKVN
ncbi:MAG: ATP synthase subunit b [Cyclobacteriaceae bacterium]|nr:MAG: ATP synthase subunit b [Cyclobacteriaceae bacterium]